MKYLKRFGLVLAFTAIGAAAIGGFLAIFLGSMFVLAHYIGNVGALILVSLLAMALLSTALLIEAGWLEEKK